MALYRLLKQCDTIPPTSRATVPYGGDANRDLISAPSRTKSLNSNLKSRPPLTIFSLGARPGIARYFSVSSAYPWTMWAALPPPGFTHKRNCQSTMHPHKAVAHCISSLTSCPVLPSVLLRRSPAASLTSQKDLTRPRADTRGRSKIYSCQGAVPLGVLPWCLATISTIRLHVRRSSDNCYSV